MTIRQRDPETGRFTASPYPCCEHCDPSLHALACASGHACPCPQCQSEPDPGIRNNPERLAFHPLVPAGWDDSRAKYIDAFNQVAIRTHHLIDQAYALILGEVPVREAPVAFIHQRGVVLELGSAAEEQIASAWQDGSPGYAEPHPSGPLPAGDWAIALPPVSLPLDPAAEQHMRNFLTLTRQDGGFSEPDEEGTSWRVTPDVPGAEGPPDSAPGTPDKAAPDEAGE